MLRVDCISVETKYLQPILQDKSEPECHDCNWTREANPKAPMRDKMDSQSIGHNWKGRKIC